MQLRVTDLDPRSGCLQFAVAAHGDLLSSTLKVIEIARSATVYVYQHARIHVENYRTLIGLRRSRTKTSITCRTYHPVIIYHECRGGESARSLIKHLKPKVSNESTAKEFSAYCTTWNSYLSDASDKYIQ